MVANSLHRYKYLMNLFNFKNKTVIITGGGTGIGFSISKSFLLNGANIVIVGRKKEVLAKAKKRLCLNSPNLKNRILTISCDMSSDESVKKLFITVKTDYKNIDVLVNNCGSWLLDKIVEMDEFSIDELYNNNLKASILGTKYAGIYLAKKGSIINIGSFSSILPMKEASLYSAYKSALNTFTKSSASELANKGIRVNCINPGVIKTPMTSKYISDNYKRIIEPIALKKIGNEQDVSNGVLFLCSDLSSYITGATLDINGGKYLTQL
jgi:3-oxoacyl-[acyl-carrier protein] reductase